MNKFSGLTAKEADSLFAKFGPNEIVQKKSTSLFKIFIRQFENLLVLLLVFAAVVSFLVGESLDAIFIAIIIVLNALLGFFQEFKAENAISALKKIVVSKSRVIRNGQELEIDSRFLVLGDIVKLEVGDKIPADAKILESFHFEVNEAALTGESLPVAKDAKTEEKNKLFMGTIAASGKAVVEILSTGNNTRFGKMASTLTVMREEKTPLSIKITALGKFLTLVAVLATVAIFILGILQNRDFLEMLLTSISLAVAAVPEGLPAVITITLAVGLQRMAKKRAILRNLSSIEALGNTTVIATDKTGTLTENKMKVVKIYFDAQLHTIADLVKNAHSSTLKRINECSVFCNNATLTADFQSKKPIILGDQTEGSLLLLASQLGINLDKFKKGREITDEFSFDEHLKMMSVVVKDKNDFVLYTKGAPENILSLSSSYQLAGKIHKMDEKTKENIKKAYEDFAKDGLRVIALAYRSVKKVEDRGKMEKELVFLGLTGIADPPRKEIKEVLLKTQKAGILTVMITGDNQLTAQTIGREIGLVSSSQQIMTGDQMKKLTDDELLKKIENIRIFARIEPEGKLRIVEAFQKKGHIVTVTGDGINDALALKKANVGVAMGITGTDLAKEVADMVITDDNFASIVSAVEEGRLIFNNIVKSITYLLACNLGEIMTIFMAIALGLPTPLIPIQILWINLVTDGLPALTLAFDPASPDIMGKIDRNERKSLTSKKSLKTIVLFSVLITWVTLLSFIYFYNTFGLAAGRNAAFTVLVASQFLVVFLIREKQSFFSNKLLLISVFTSMVLQAMILTIPPLQTLFKIH